MDLCELQCAVQLKQWICYSLYITNCPEEKWDMSDVLQGDYMAICFMIPFSYCECIFK